MHSLEFWNCLYAILKLEIMHNERRDHFYNFNHITEGFQLIFIDWRFNELHKVSLLKSITRLLLQAVILGI